jgi:branched-chain amino acid transport system substrate-binding protein
MRASWRGAAAVASAGVLAMSLAGCAGSAGAHGNEITLGVLGPITGSQAEIGKNQVAAAQVAVAEINADGGINGKKVRLVKHDEGATPDVAASAIRKLAGDGVSLQLGLLSSANCLATAPILPRLGVVMLGTGCTNDGLAGLNGAAAPNANFFRVGTNDSQLIEGLAAYIAQKFPHVTDYDAFGYDYVTGTTQWKSYQKDIKADGVALRPKKQIFVTLGEQNFKQYVQSLADKSGDPKNRALNLGTYGSGTGSFLQQAQDFDLASKYALIVQPGGYYPIARTLGGRAPEVWNAYDYSYSAYNNAMNTRFVHDFRAKTGQMPESWGFDAYLAVFAYKAAIEKAGSADYEKVLKALPGVSFASPAGQLTIDATSHMTNVPVVATDTVGDPKSTEDVKFLQTQIIRPED